MQKIGEDLIDLSKIKEVVEARDEQIGSGFGKDAQIKAIRDARRYIGDKYFRTAKLGRIMDRSQGPLVAVRLSIVNLRL